MQLLLPIYYQKYQQCHKVLQANQKLQIIAVFYIFMMKIKEQKILLQPIHIYDNQDLLMLHLMVQLKKDYHLNFLRKVLNIHQDTYQYALELLFSYKYKQFNQQGQQYHKDSLGMMYKHKLYFYLFDFSYLKYAFDSFYLLLLI